MEEQYTACDELQSEEATGAGHVIQCLKKLGVTTVFGYPRRSDFTTKQRCVIRKWFKARVNSS